MEAVYADGWDQGIVNPLPRHAAHDRHLAGRPYTVVLTVAPPEVSGHEFPYIAARRQTTYRADGVRIDREEPQGDRGPCHESHILEAAPHLPVPAFGQWHALLALVGDHHATVTETASSALPTRTAATPPWRPPRPLRPHRIEDLFHPGAERRIEGERLLLSPHPAGAPHLTSGHLVAADPSSLTDDAARLDDAWHDLGPLDEPQFTVIGADEMIAWSSGWGDGAYPGSVATRPARSPASSPTCCCSPMNPTTRTTTSSPRSPRRTARRHGGRNTTLTTRTPAAGGGRRA